MVRVEERRVRRWDAEQWMSHRRLPRNLIERIRRHEEYKWQETGGVEEDSLIQNLPRDLRRDVKRHLYSPVLKRVVIFQKMNEDLLDELYDRLKPALYTEMSFIIREGCPVDEMLFLVRGTLSLMAKDGGSYCGMELLPWALNSHPSSSSLPISTRTVQAVTDIEAYALSADDLKFVTSQFRLHSNQFQHIFRFYSPEWRTWAACFIQAAWRLHYRNRLMKSLREEEDRLQAALAKESIDSPSLGATINASRFAANALRALQRNHTIGAELSPTLPLLLQKPVGPDYSEKNDSGGGETS